MTGLKTRLALARTLVWTGLHETPDDLAQVVRQLVAGRADLIVIVQPDARDDDLAQGYRAALPELDGRAVLGIAGDERSAIEVRTDLFVSDAGRPPRHGHQWGLAVAVAGDAAELSAALADDRVDAVVVASGLVAPAVRLAPPADAASKPWFAQAADLAQARELVGLGACRLAFPTAPPGDKARDAVRRSVAGYRDLVADRWRTDLEAVTFAALRKDDNVSGPLGSSRAVGDGPWAVGPER